MLVTSISKDLAYNITFSLFIYRVLSSFSCLCLCHLWIEAQHAPQLLQPIRVQGVASFKDAPLRTIVVTSYYLCSWGFCVLRLTESGLSVCFSAVYKLLLMTELPTDTDLFMGLLEKLPSLWRHTSIGLFCTSTVGWLCHPAAICIWSCYTFEIGLTHWVFSSNRNTFLIIIFLKCLLRFL